MSDGFERTNTDTRGEGSPEGIATIDGDTGRLRADPQSTLLFEQTWYEARDAVERDAVVIIPIGATEQHGPHLPLGTDAIIATELALSVAARIDAVVAPPLVYGNRSRPLSGGGQGFVGTTSLRPQTFLLVVQDVVSELLRHGYKKIVLLNCHWENRGLVYEAALDAQTAMNRPDARIMVIESVFGTGVSAATMDVLFSDEFPGWDVEHAGILETSMLLYLRPELVRRELIADDKSERHPWYDVLPVPATFVPKSGAMWKSSQGDSEKGALVWHDVVGHVLEAIEIEFAPTVTNRHQSHRNGETS